MIRNPLVSVVLPAYNAETHLKGALDSVFAQTYQSIEVIVVDDGSTDATAEIAKGFPDVHYVRQVNRGPSAARNSGIEVARGECVAFLDADDLWEAEKLNEQITILDADPDAGLSFSDMRLFSQPGPHQPSMFAKYGYTDEFFGDNRLVLDPVRKLVRANFIPTSSVVARKDAILSAGGFDEQFYKAEDWDLWLRVALHFPIVYSPKVLLRKRVHEVNVSRDVEGMNVAAIQVLEKFKRQNPDLLRKLDLDLTGTLRDGYRNLGYFYLRQRSVAPARAALWRSLSLGFQWRALIYFLSTLLGSRFVSSVVRARG